MTVTCGGAQDVAGNAGSATATYSVAYAFCGFQQPLLAPVQVFKKGSTVPVKFCLVDASGAKVTAAVAAVYANGILQGIAPYLGGNSHYHFNLRTRDLPTGPLTISVQLDDGTTHSIVVVLR